MKPAESHCARSWPSEKTRDMSGMATLTIVDAMIDATVPIITVASTRQRYDGPKRSAMEALREYLDWRTPQIADLRKAIAAADDGDFASDEEVAAVFDRCAKPAPAPASRIDRRPRRLPRRSQNHRRLPRRWPCAGPRSAAFANRGIRAAPPWRHGSSIGPSTRRRSPSLLSVRRADECSSASLSVRKT